MKKNGKHLDRLMKTRIQFQTTLSPLEKWFLQKAAKKVDESLANFLRTSALDRGAGLISGPVDAHRAEYLKSIKTSARRSPRTAK